MGTIDLTRTPPVARLICACLAVALLVAAGSAKAASPHWKRNACETCHASPAPTAEAPALKTTPADALCGTCHDGREAKVCRHRSGIATGADSSVGKDFKGALENDQVVCTTCHDMAPHCALDVKQKYRNDTFLRGGPFDNDSDQCFGCHSKRGYRQPSPHMQVKKGEIKEGHCYFCHGAVPQKDASGQWLPVEFGTTENLSKLCQGCHSIGPHPSSSVTGKKGWMHMVVPPPEYAERMQASVAARGGHLPLDPGSGEIMCATCHNPHDPRLEGYPNAGEEDTTARLRYENMCGVCHEK